MSSNSISIKPNNHRVYQCPNDKKTELLKTIINDNKELDILVVTANEPQAIIEQLEDSTIKVITDKELVTNKELKVQMIIGYDMPIKAIVYIARVSKATHKAVILVNEEEQKELHQIEMLLGRSIKQDVIEGFEYPKKETPKEDKSAPKKMTQTQIKEVAKKRYDEKTQEPKEKKFDKEKPRFDKDKPRFDKEKKPFNKDEKKRDFKKSDSAGKWDKKKKEPNKFLGYDENGKAKFSGKSGERNHRHDGTPKEKYDAPKKPGRTINIKERKTKED